MGKITLNNDISKMFVGNDEVEMVYYGNVLVYQKSNANNDRFVLNVTTGLYQNSDLEFCYGLLVSVSAGPSQGCSVTFNGETKNVPANTSQSVEFFEAYEDDPNYQPITGNVTVTGDITDFGVSHMFATGPIINSVVTWYSNQNYLFNTFWFFDPNDSYAYALSFNLDLPANIEDASRLSQNFTAPYSVSFTNNLKKIARLDSLTTANTGVQLKNTYLYYIDDVLVNIVVPSSSASVTIPNNTRVIADSIFSNRGDIMTKIYPNFNTINFPTDNVLKAIPGSFIDGNTNVSTLGAIPASVEKIGNSAFAGCSVSSFRFNQPANMSVEMGTSVFNAGKNAKTIDVYTDNLTIKNYDYTSDNVTPTFYHLDGTPW